MKELLESMGAAQWRVRESACSAIGDALQGCSFQQMEPFLEQVREEYLFLFWNFLEKVSLVLVFGLDLVYGIQMSWWH